MLALLVISYAVTAAAAPATYDQRQDGDFNVRADVQNVVLLVAMPKLGVPTNVFDGFFKSAKPVPGIQERADVQVMEAFVEPSTPYQVEIGSGRDVEGDARAVEVVIAGRRRSNAVEAAEGEELKLLGATEQCGPDRERDPVTLSCRARSAAPSDKPESDPAAPSDKPESDPAAPQPEVVPAA